MIGWLMLKINKKITAMDQRSGDQFSFVIKLVVLSLITASPGDFYKKKGLNESARCLVL